ncbi:MAG TPA: hypothetical protein VHE83_13020 [Mycobacteriales bacterium]|nr:hypothetical protein [Mycobacteriales bacterium]
MLKRVRLRLMLALAVTLAAIGYIAWPDGHHTTPQCLVSAPPRPDPYALTPEQAGNASTIAAVGIRKGLPDHAVTIALATALQESGLRNLTYGDRDSLGLFQQRPSQGWGTRAQLLDPVYAANAFYEHLEHEDGWQTMSVTAAAQGVQRSAAPMAYAQWEAASRAIAAALTGEHTAAFTCAGVAVAPGTTPVADLAQRELGTRQISGPHDTARGWAIASWLVAQAPRLGIASVTFDGQQWTTKTGAWKPISGSAGSLAFSLVAA